MSQSGNVRYQARVLCPDEGLLTVDRFALDMERLRDELLTEGKTLLSAKVTRPGRSKTERFPLLVFCQQLVSLLQAGLQLVEAVDTLAEKERNTAHHDMLAQLQSSLRSGLSFSQALALWPGVFPPLFQTAIEASEQTGDVLQALQRFIVYETQFQTLRSRLTGALIYPALLLSLGGLVIAFLLGYVVPRFSVVFMDRLQDMPYLSGVVIRLGLSIDAHPVIALLSFCGVVSGVVLTVLHPAMRNWAVGMAMHIPWLGEHIRLFELVRLYRSLGMLLRGGIAAVQSLEMMAAMVPARSSQRIQRVIAVVREGLPISTALQREGFTTVVSERLLAVGERSGQMGDMLERSADFLDTELEQSIDKTIRLMEPLMMVIIGVLIGGIVMLMYLPIFELADSVG
jgi:general secretion pathway protein F